MTINDQQSATCIEINTNAAVKKVVIWLHGLGADGDDFVPIVPELKLPDSLGVKFIFPHAPVMPVTLNQGYEMRAWYDIYGVSLASKIDEIGIAKSVTLVENLIATEEANGLTSDHVFLAGFSQGAVIALTTGLRYAKPLAGIIALSGYLPLTDKMLYRHPIFLAHGTEDFVVPYVLGEKANEKLKEAGYPVEWHSYPMPHSVCAEEIRDISRFITNQK